MKKMRPLRTGGYSMCSCPDELVGKGRCRHVLGIAQVIYDDKENRVKIVDMSGLSVDENQAQEIKNVLENIPRLPEEKVDKLVDYFKNFKM